MRQVEIKSLSPGTTFFYRGLEATVLEHTGTGVFVQLNASISHRKFGCTNDWRESDLRKYLNGAFAQELTQGHSNELMDTVTDLTAEDGTTDYGTSVDKVTLLTVDQCRKYRYIRALPDVWMWLATPASTPGGWDSNATRAGILNTVGNLFSGDASGTHGARPAFTLPSSLTVKVSGDVGLGNFSDAELLTELLNRQKEAS